MKPPKKGRKKKSPSISKQICKTPTSVNLSRALDEVERAKRGEIKLMTEEELMDELKAEGII